MPWRKPSRSEIVHIVVTGYQKKKEPSKHYVFVIDITWNNSERFEIYRRYSDFFSFQTTLKALFPAAAGKKGNDPRVIPQLPKRIFVGRSHVAKVAEARLEQINRYCQTLISLEPLISESVHVIGYFSPRSTDKPLPKLHLHRPASIHPQKVPPGSLFEDYCALAEYQAEDDSQISFKAGEKIMVLSKDESGWWMCSVEGGKVGWAPPSYLKKCDKCNEGESDSDDEYIGLPLSYAKEKDSDDSGVGDHDSESTPSNSLIQGFKVPEIEAEEYKAIDSYEAEGPGQVSFEAGSIVHVLDKMEDGWWFVSNGTDEGWAPCSYLENINGEDEAEVAISSLEIQRYEALEEYKAEEEDELSFPKGVIVDVLQKRLDGWWLIKHHTRIGLAPATFLKKVSTVSAVTCGSDSGGEETLFKRINVGGPVQPEFLITNKQPPRKQSVRYRASLKNRAATKPKVDKKPTEKLSPLATIQSRPLSPIPSDSEHPKSPAKECLKAPITSRPPRSATPFSSDSESETAKPQPPKSPRMKRNALESRIKKFEKRRESDSSMSEDSSSPIRTQPEYSKKMSTPDIKMPPLLKVQGKSYSVDEPMVNHRRGEGPRPPPRPYKQGQKASNVPKITEDLLRKSPSTLSTPNIPSRPTVSVIRKAKEGRSRSTSPFIKGEGEGDTDASSVFSVSSKSSSEVSKPPPPPHRVNPRKKMSAQETASPSLLPPPVPRRKSTSDVESELQTVAPPLIPPPQRPTAVTTTPASGNCNPLSQQMADTLIKYILASEDPTLKLELRKIITGDPEVMQAITQTKSPAAPLSSSAPAPLPPHPPHRPY